MFCTSRKRLFSLLNDLPTIFEVVTERKPVKDKSNADSGSKSRGNTKVGIGLSPSRTASYCSSLFLILFRFPPFHLMMYDVC